MLTLTIPVPLRYRACNCSHIGQLKQWRGSDCHICRPYFHGDETPPNGLERSESEYVHPRPYALGVASEKILLVGNCLLKIVSTACMKLFTEDCFHCLHVYVTELFSLVNN